MEHEIKDLPLPEPLAQAQSERLIQTIRQRIQEQGGRISFADYMALALYAPGLGYYSAGNQKFGAGGDFVTAPEISPWFSRCLARQCQQILAQLNQQGEPTPVILEVGGGSGIMAADVLVELERLDSMPGEYWILELSADLRQRQSQTLASKVPHLQDKVRWLDALPASAFSGVVLANELLDAMPVHRFHSSGEGGPVGEYGVTWEHEHFAWQLMPPSSELLKQRIETIVQTLVNNGNSAAYTSEINLAAESWVKTLGELLHAGMVLIVDYGFPRHEYYHPQRSGGTLMCHYRHRSHDDPFVYPGLQDITAHVDFTAVAEAGAEAGLHVAGYNTQGFFLLATGIDDALAGVDPDNARDYLRLSQQVKTLTLPSEMGELFKVMALTKNIDVPPLGFTLQDLRSRL